jgi:polysaccharide biosynthesis/export protein
VIVVLIVNITALTLTALVICGSVSAQEAKTAAGATNRQPAIAAPPTAYVLGPEDVLSVKVINADEVGTSPYPIGLDGKIKLPFIGSMQASGLTVSQLQEHVADQFKAYVRHPDVTIAVTEFRSQPISVLGAVGSPGTYQIRGRKTLFEVISEAGGLKADAGNVINITRQKIFGEVPISGATDDATGQFSIGQLNIRSVMRAEDPAANAVVKPFDVLTVPKADLIYVVGDVKKPGGFPLIERPTMSLLEALSIAEGLGKTAGAKDAKILRSTNGSGERIEERVDLKQILGGRKADMFLRPNDILYIPTSGMKVAGNRAVEALVQIGTGVAIFAK